MSISFLSMKKINKKLSKNLIASFAFALGTCNLAKASSKIEESSVVELGESSAIQAHIDQTKEKTKTETFKENFVNFRRLSFSGRLGSSALLSPFYLGEANAIFGTPADDVLNFAENALDFNMHSILGDFGIDIYYGPKNSIYSSFRLVFESYFAPGQNSELEPSFSFQFSRRMGYSYRNDKMHTAVYGIFSFILLNGLEFVSLTSESNMATGFEPGIGYIVMPYSLPIGIFFDVTFPIFLGNGYGLGAESTLNIYDEGIPVGKNIAMPKISTGIQFGF